LNNYKGAIKDGKEYNSGEIMDPKMEGITNVLSFCKSKDKLKVRDILDLRYWVEPNIGIELSNFFVAKTNSIHAIFK
jgi:hypothetical protein